jgi:DNA-binding HxlR family transcriptional regulator
MPNPPEPSPLEPLAHAPEASSPAAGGPVEDPATAAGGPVEDPATAVGGPVEDPATGTRELIDDPATSALAGALAAVGDRWTLLLIAALLDGPRRFGELQGEVHGIAPNVLIQRLRQLERNALLVTRPYSERPPRFVYELSSAGRELAGALRLLAGWGARNAEGGSAPRHTVCGTPMEARWWCPTCQRPVVDEEGEELHFA